MLSVLNWTGSVDRRERNSIKINVFFGEWQIREIRRRWRTREPAEYFLIDPCTRILGTLMYTDVVGK